ncbi:MAG: RDD family protein [Phycisphaeraceae bacterium]|nr:RDD family protein [Phycisphaeraceae bacterium]
MPVRSMLSVLARVVAALMAASSSYGQTDTPAEAVIAGSRITHGWVTIRDDRDQSTLLLHLPPRAKTATGGSEWGTVRIAPSVAHPTEALAAYGSRVWLVLQAERSGEDHIRRVVTLSASPSLGGAWDYPPGRPEVCPPLPGQVELVGAAGTSRGPVVLLRSRESAPDASNAIDTPWRLQILTGSGWESLQLPWSADEPIPQTGDVIRVVGMAGAIGILIHPQKGISAELWRAPFNAGGGAEHTAELLWTRSTFSLEELPDGFFPDAVYQVGDGRSEQLIGVRSLPGQGVEVVGYRAGRGVMVAALPQVPRTHRIAPMDGTGSLAVLWWESSPAAKTDSKRPAVPGGTSARVFRIAEVSASSGRVLYEGPTTGGGVFSAREFQTLAVALLLITAVVLLFALRTDGGSAPALPPGLAIATPGQRLIAALADLAPGVLLSSLVTGVGLGQMFNPLVFLGPEAEPMAWPMALLFTVIHCTIGEWSIGRSIGKSLVGLRVVAIRRDEDTGQPRLAPLRFWQAALRNIARWSIPALGMLILVDPSRRYPPDLAARTMVVGLASEADED